MGFRRSDLQEAFFVPGTHAFRVYGYGTTDPLEEVLAPGYFAHGTGLLRPGDQQLPGASAGRGGSGRAAHGPGNGAPGRAQPGARRRLGAPGPGLRSPERSAVPSPSRPGARCCRAAGVGVSQAWPRPPARQQEQDARHEFGSRLKTRGA
jgi:hypothetical protein